LKNAVNLSVFVVGASVVFGAGLVAAKSTVGDRDICVILFGVFVALADFIGRFSVFSARTLFVVLASLIVFSIFVHFTIFSALTTI
jgi:hypothetical protein